MPSPVPNAVPRRIGFHILRKSSRPGSSREILSVKTSREPLGSRLETISATPNTPMVKPMNPIPSASSMMPKVNRRTPELASVPTVPMSRPSKTIAMALRSDPWARTVAPTSPNTIREKYSAGPNFRATSASGGANMATATVPTHPAKNDPSAAVASAGPARPWRAIS
jgi:hypothetical protein